MSEASEISDAANEEHDTVDNDGENLSLSKHHLIWQGEVFPHIHLTYKTMNEWFNFSITIP